MTKSELENLYDYYLTAYNYVLFGAPNDLQPPRTNKLDEKLAMALGLSDAKELFVVHTMSELENIVHEVLGHDKAKGNDDDYINEPHF